MYRPTLLPGAAWLWMRPTPLRGALYPVLRADLVVKLHYEERLLRSRYPACRAYARRTKRLVPLCF